MSSTDDALAPALQPKDGVYKRGFGLKAEILGELASDYHSELVEEIRARGGRIEMGGIEFRLAKEFGFCYGVDKAVDFAYETRRRFPDRRIYLTAEIIHNPRVNGRLIEMGIRFLSGQYADGTRLEDLTVDDVVILPAFGVSREELDELKRRGPTLVDTTCGSVVHVWKRVERYAMDGFTSVIHGKARHEETIATASQAWQSGRGAYLVVLDRDEAELVCEFIRTGRGAAELAERFKGKTSPGFDFERDLERIGVANQTTMLSSDSLEIAGMIRQAILDRRGEAGAAERFRAFDTICSATQERQDAVIDMMKTPPDAMIVIGGFNSSNTRHLSELCAQTCPTRHIEDASDLLDGGRIRHLPWSEREARIEEGWLPGRRPLSIGVTAGASTPNKVIGDVIERIVAAARG